MENIIVIANANIPYDLLQGMYKSVAKYPHLPGMKVHAIFVLTKYLWYT